MRQITCAELVELVTDHLEGTLDAEAEARFLQHVADCPGCETYVDQFRETVRRAGRIEPDAVDPAVVERLLEAFRDWA